MCCPDSCPISRCPCRDCRPVCGHAVVARSRRGPHRPGPCQRADVLPALETTPRRSWAPSAPPNSTDSRDRRRLGRRAPAGRNARLQRFAARAGLYLDLFISPHAPNRRGLATTLLTAGERYGQTLPAPDDAYLKVESFGGDRGSGRLWPNAATNATGFTCGCAGLRRRDSTAPTGPWHQCERDVRGSVAGAAPGRDGIVPGPLRLPSTSFDLFRAGT